MAGEFREFSVEEASSVIPHFGDSSQLVEQAKPKKKDLPETARAPLNTMQLPLNNTPVAQTPDTQSVTNAVTQANQQIQQGLPKPQAPSSVQELGKEVTQVGKSIGDTLMENWWAPAGILAIYGAHKLLSEKPVSTVHPSEQPQPPSNKSIRDRMLLGEVKEPTLEPTATEKPPTSLFSPAEQEMIARGEENRFQKQVESSQKAEQGKVPGSLKPAAPVQPVVAAPPAVAQPQVPVAPTVAQVAAETAPTVAPTVAQITQEAAPAKETGEAKNKGGRPKGAVSMKDTPETWVKLTKEGTTFLPGYGPGDNNLYNTYGAEGRRAILEKYNEGKPIGSYENYLKLNEKLKLGVPASEVPGLMARLPSEEEAGNFSKLGKAAKIAGVGGLLIGTANLANAKTRGERGMAGANLLEAILPPGANINEAGAPVLPPSVLAAQKRQLEEMQKLGSPYRTR